MVGTVWIIPRLSPSSLYYVCDSFICKIITHTKEGESLGGFDHVDTDDAFNVHCVHVCEPKGMRKEARSVCS